MFTYIILKCRVYFLYILTYGFLNSSIFRFYYITFCIFELLNNSIFRYYYFTFLYFFGFLYFPLWVPFSRLPVDFMRWALLYLVKSPANLQNNKIINSIPFYGIFCSWLVEWAGFWLVQGKIQCQLNLHLSLSAIF